MDEHSLGERIAMGLATKCARLEDERDDAIRERDEARIALSIANDHVRHQDAEVETLIRERDEAQKVARGLYQRTPFAARGWDVLERYPWLTEGEQ